jgi:hypothetical protein
MYDESDNGEEGLGDFDRDEEDSPQLRDIGLKT